MLKSVPLALAAALFAGAASAATATADLNVRSGPGTGYPVVGVIAANTVLSIGSCTDSWCRVDANGASGWASSDYLASGGPRAGSTVTFSSTAPFLFAPSSRADNNAAAGHRYNVFPSENDPNYATDIDGDHS